MSQVIPREAAMIGLGVRKRQNRDLLGELLADYHLVDLEGAVPEGADLCVVDEGGFEQCRHAIVDWKGDQSPVFAPVLLLASAEGRDPWARHADHLGETLDAILEVPAPRRAILSRAESLLETRRYALELSGERELNRRIFETSPAAKIVLDDEGIIRRANRRAEEMLGIEASSLVERRFDRGNWQLTDLEGDPIPEEELPFGRVIETGEPVYGQELIVEQPGEADVWLSVNMAPLRDETGEIEYLVAAMDDVTEERRLERELRASEELHRTTLEDITDTVVITDEEGRFTYVCPNTQHIFDLTTGEVEALGDVETLLGTDPAPDNLQSIGLVENVELEVTDAEGDEHTVLVTVKAVSIQHGSRLYTVRDITERAAAERALEETVESRTLALEAAEAGVWEWDLRTDEITLDDSLERLSDFPGAEFERLDDVFGRLIHPDDAGRIEAAIDRAISSGDPFDITTRVYDADDQVRWLQTRGRPVTDGNGEPERLLGVAIDVTKRVARERELERYERIVETAPDPIYALDAEGVITLANKAFGEIFGADPESLIGSDIADLLEPASLERSVEHIRALRAGNAGPEPIELTVETVDGSREYEVNIALHGGDGDGPPGTVGVAHDVTERRRRERLLRRAQRAIEASGHAIYITDPDGKIIYANPAFERVTGYGVADAVGRTPAILRSSTMPDEHFVRLWETISAGEIWDEEVINVRKDGDRYHADQTIAPIIDQSGEIEGYVAIQTDISAHKDRLQQLQVMDRVLRHNLHNALNVVLGHADLIRESTEGQPAEDAATIVRKGRQLLDLADKQRAITRVLSEEPYPEPTDLASNVELIASDVAAAHPEADVRLELPEEARAIATEDLDAAVRELLVNAIEHAEDEAPVVWVSVEVADGRVELQVADEGPGIPEVERRIVTGERSPEPLYHGSGLGLWLVAQIVRRSGGTLEFADRVPRGTVVTVGLPAADG